MADTDNTKEGGCQCGAVRYRLAGKPVALVACHCRDCQRQSGSAFGLSLIVSKDSFELLSGNPRSFTKTAESRRAVDCTFCPDCGTRLYHEPESMPDTMNIKAGTLDDTSWLKPGLHVWTKSKQPWVPIPDDVPTIDEQP